MKRILFAALLAGAAFQANAVVTTYTTRTDFLLATGAVTVENFNTFATEISFRTVPLDVGPFTLSGFGDRQLDRNFIDIPPYQFSDFNIDGTPNVNGFVFGVTTGFTFTFDAAITAWGADFAAFQNSIPRSNISVAGELLTPPIQLRGNVNSFFGFVSTAPFTTVTFIGSDENNGDGFSIDNVTFSTGASVPEPASLALFGIGLAGLGFMRRRRT